VRVALCTTCKGRLPHLAETLPANLASEEGTPDVVFVVLDYNSRDGLADWVQTGMRHEMNLGRLVYYRFTEPTAFRMAHAKNLAHRLGLREGADVLVNVDADNFTMPGFVPYLREHFLNDLGSFLWARMIKAGDGDGNGTPMARGVSGRIAVTREQFLLAGGYNEKYTMWSPDDTDFKLRLRRLGFKPVEVDPRFLHAINHNDRMRFREYPQAGIVLDVQNESHFDQLEKETTTIANYGHCGEGVVYRNFDTHLPIELRPMPTRVFGIGFHKTGTSSLSVALRRLGYSCTHWPNAHWARRVYTDMTTAGTSLALEQTMAATDFPIAILFRQLDAAYPGSKFILTTRNEWDWLASVARHFSPENPHHETWNGDPFSHRLHNLVYGRRKFDESIFLARYRQHHTEVREYFRGRPGDLLEFDLGRGETPGAGWHELCGFLREPIPSEPFPVENVALQESL
jgi:hypothetical protein